MAYIYKIINSINNRVYVGKTALPIEKRLEQHLYDAKKEKTKNRPLYNAINKYGSDKFSIQVLEECSLEELNEKEIEWIEIENSYHDGYNATRGGEGTFLIERAPVLALYEETKNCSEVARTLGISSDSVYKILSEYKIKPLSPGQVTARLRGKRVIAIDKNTLEEYVFNNQMDAARWLREGNITLARLSSVSSRIGEVVSGARKSAYGFYWKRVE